MKKLIFFVVLGIVFIFSGYGFCQSNPLVTVMNKPQTDTIHYGVGSAIQFLSVNMTIKEIIISDNSSAATVTLFIGRAGGGFTWPIVCNATGPTILSPLNLTVTNSATINAPANINVYIGWE